MVLKQRIETYALNPNPENDRCAFFCSHALMQNLVANPHVKANLPIIFITIFLRFSGGGLLPMSARRLIMRQKRGEALSDDEMRILEDYRLKERLRQRQLRVRKHKELSDAKATQLQENENRNVMDIVSILQELPFERRRQADDRPAHDHGATKQPRQSDDSHAQMASVDDSRSGSHKEDKQPEHWHGPTSSADNQKHGSAGDDLGLRNQATANSQDPLVPYTVLIPKSAIGAFYCVYCAFMAGHSVALPNQGAGEQKYFPEQKIVMAPPPPQMPSSY
ncbi:hypothetical protein V1509DRAFT_616282 [Lipomyces kononenkoae]